MDPKPSTDLEQDVRSPGIANDYSKSDKNVASNAAGEEKLPAQGDALSSLANGHPSPVHPGTTEPTPQVEDPPLNPDNPQQPGSNPKPATSNAAPAPSNQTVDSSSNPIVTPFIHAHPSTKFPTAAALTPDQSAKYTTLLTIARSWTSIPSSSKSTTDASPLTPTEKLWLTRDCLLRYLRASKWVVPTAKTRLLSTLTWRREYGVESLTADYISEENETGKQVILGYDNNGRPCLYLNPHKQNTKGKEKQIQHLVFMLERCLDLMPPGVETLALVVNFKESRQGQSASVGQGRQTLSILQNHYPERLGRALVQDVPWLVWGFFKAIGPFIDPLTKEKLKFDEDLRELVPPEQLIASYKGDVVFEYEHGKYWKALNQLAEERRTEALTRWEKAGGLIGESERYLRGHGESAGATEDGVAEGLEKGMENLKTT